MNAGIALILLFDLVAATVLAYGIYFRRHRRRDMLVAYLALNVGVLAVTIALSSVASGAGIGLGLGLFGVLSIIRLRSSQLTQEEVAYYFVALALGLLCGLRPGSWWVAPFLAIMLLAVMYVADHPRLLRRHRQQLITLDAAYTDETQLIRRIEDLFAAKVSHLVVIEVNLVLDQTIVDVRFRLPGGPRTVARVAAWALGRAFVPAPPASPAPPPAPSPAVGIASPTGVAGVAR
ncbi:DUF4956 domain-containing protein [Micromonospora sp. NBC_01813]|uniref:DUF4956 domain-containing protein n=1 Tax=Micromonospora sp. NBC_01813 TaxID=2975988 RepID=UPI002DDBACBF|nr:DUF4956 domain-containing protein [Micromonospora sp. NBC_01813]WSA09097.1 DUF4956 domain-containing protein [Micromonospora sp. NBC_01813]